MSKASYATVTLKKGFTDIDKTKYPQGFRIYHIGDIYRCPIDTAYTLVATGKATHPGGLSAIENLLQKPDTLASHEILHEINTLKSGYTLLKPFIFITKGFISLFKFFQKFWVWILSIATTIAAFFGAYQALLHWGII